MKRLALAIVVVWPCAGLWFSGGLLAGQVLMAIGQPGLAVPFYPDPARKGAALYAAGRWEEAAASFGAERENAYNHGLALARLGHYGEAMDAFDLAIDLEPGNEDAKFNSGLMGEILKGGAVDKGKKSGSGADSTAIEARQGHVRPDADVGTIGAGNGFAGTQEGASSNGAPGGGKVGKSGAGNDNAASGGDGQAKGSASSGSGAGKTGGMALDVAAALRRNNQRIQPMMTQHAVAPTAEWLAARPDDPGQYLKLRILAEQERRRGLGLASGEDER